MVENSDFAECYKCNCKINPIEGNNQKINIISLSCNHQLCYKYFIHLLLKDNFLLYHLQNLVKIILKYIVNVNKKVL